MRYGIDRYYQGKYLWLIRLGRSLLFIAIFILLPAVI